MTQWVNIPAEWTNTSTEWLNEQILSVIYAALTFIAKSRYNYFEAISKAGFFAAIERYNCFDLMKRQVDVSDFAGTLNPQFENGLFFGGYDGSSFGSTTEYITINTLGNSKSFGNLLDVVADSAAFSNGTNSRGINTGGVKLAPGVVNSKKIEYININSMSNSILFGDLLAVRNALKGTSNGESERGIIAGGYNIASVNTIEYITINSIGDSIDFGDLLTPNHALSSCSNSTNERGIFGGGYTAGTYFNVIQYITINSIGNATDFGDLVIKRRDCNSCSNGINNRGIFGGGYGPSTSKTIDYITINSLGNASNFGNLTNYVYTQTSTSNGTNERGIIAGGYNYISGWKPVNVIEYITINSTGNAIDFGDLMVANISKSSTSNR